VVLTGYIDDSGNGKLFTLSCLIGPNHDWAWMEFEWQKCLEKRNAELAKVGRPPIRRFHASDCSSCQGDFSGWDVKTEQIPFMADLLSVIEKYRLDVIALTVDLNELSECVPAARHNPLRYANMMLLHQLMIQIADTTLAINGDAVIGLIHDRGNFDSVLLDSFNLVIKNSLFDSRGRFTTLAPLSWEDCIPLQLADFMAFENFKESERGFFGRARRKSLEMAITRGRLGGTLHAITRGALTRYVEWFQTLQPHAQKLMYDAARVPKNYRRG
jgi:hypothetical protein